MAISGYNGQRFADNYIVTMTKEEQKKAYNVAKVSRSDKE